MVLQADEGPDEKGGIAEAQGTGGEEQERSSDGRGQEEGGQHVRILPAGKGEAYEAACWYPQKEMLGQNPEKVSTCLCFHEGHSASEDGAH